MSRGERMKLDPEHQLSNEINARLKAADEGYIPVEYSSLVFNLGDPAEPGVIFRGLPISRVQVEHMARGLRMFVEGALNKFEYNNTSPGAA
jgi:hypothetical protein